MYMKGDVGASLCPCKKREEEEEEEDLHLEQGQPKTLVTNIVPSDILTRTCKRSCDPLESL